MTAAVWVAVIAAIAACVLSPFVTWWVAHRTRTQEWARLDQVAARAQAEAQAAADRAEQAASRAKEATEAAAARAEQAARLLLASNAEIARVQQETTTATNGRLAQIHTLVNSDLTASLQGELDALKARLKMMRQLIKVREEAGLGPGGVLGDEEALRARVGVLEANLAQRKQQTAVADAERADADHAAPAGP